MRAHFTTNFSDLEYIPLLQTLVRDIVRACYSLFTLQEDNS